MELPRGGSRCLVSVDNTPDCSEAWAMEGKCPVQPLSSRGIRTLQPSPDQPHYPEAMPGHAYLLLKAGAAAQAGMASEVW